MRFFLCVTLLGCVSCGLLLAGISPMGNEFQANTYTTGGQSHPAVASDTLGSFVVVWSGSWALDGSATGIFGQRFDSTGLPAGPEFQVNSFWTSYQEAPAIASGPAGNFVAVWNSSGPDGSANGISGRLFDSTGLPIGEDFQVNTYRTSFQESPSLATNAAGQFAVVWRSSGQDGSGWGAFGQAFDETGLPAGTEFQINTWTTGVQDPSSVAMNDSGDFVVVWSSQDQDGSASGVFGRRFDSTGTPLGSEFQVNTWTTSYQEVPAVASDAEGNFMVAWQSWDQDGSYWGIIGRRFDSEGMPLGPEHQVNVYTPNHQQTPAIAADVEGGFIVSWVSAWQDGSENGVFGRRIDSNGMPVGDEIQISGWTTGSQDGPSVAADAFGGFVVAWQSPDQDDKGVFSRRFLGRSPTILDPLDGDMVDCGDPRLNRPTFFWDDDGYDRFRVFIGWDPGFGKGYRLTSGDKLLRNTYWTPSKKKWRKACAKALDASPGSPRLYLMVYGVDRDLSKKMPTKKVYGSVVEVFVQ